jgi:P4 family phage/plasmid primase-like protien
MVWNNERWVVDQSDVIARFLYRRVAVRQLGFARELADAYKQVAGAQGSAELRKLMNQWVAHANNSGNIANIRRALESAQSVREGVSVRFEELDKDRHSLGCANGVVRVDDSGNIEVIDNAKELLITKNTGIPYIPLKQQKSEGKRLFKEFLDKFIAPSIDINYFQKLCGSTVLGGNREKMSLFFWGKTDTCKSTMLQLMVNSLGDYAGFRNPDIFKSQHLNPALAQALSLRIMAVSELGDNEINSELFKNITGGERITVELKGSNNLVSDIPQFTPIITTNGVPRVPGEDTAFRNRLRVIEFQHQATDLDKLSGNQERLYRLGGEAVLAWLIEGAAKYVKEGLLPVPVEILMATEEFASKLSDLADFAQTNLESCEGSFVRGEDIFFRFKQWADRNNFNQKGWGRTRLTQKLKALGFKDHRKMVVKADGTKELARGFVNVKLSGGEIEHSKEEK